MSNKRKMIPVRESIHPAKPVIKCKQRKGQFMDLKEEDILGDTIHTHWYYVSKGRALASMINGIDAPHILDVGAGSGIFSKRLLESGFAQSATCVDPNYPEEYETRHADKPLRFVQNVSEVPQKLILMMDVLEHVDDDVNLLKLYTDQMPKGGYVLITVPAFQLLWSGHDVFLEHRRRYTISLLEKAVTDAGMTPIKSRYFFGSLFPMLALYRWATALLVKTGNIKARSSLKKCSGPLNMLLTKIHDAERVTLFRHNKVAGLSVFCLCQKL